MIAVMIAGVVAGVLSLLVTRFLISAFRTRGLGQPILGKEDRGPELAAIIDEFIRTTG